MNIEEELKVRTEYVEDVLKKYLPKENESYKTLTEAFSYSLMAGGKRLRPIFMLEAFRLFNANGPHKEIKMVEPFMAALEMIHTYSLVHDDLPAMDNDEYRRGRKTTHIVFGEAVGILAGDALLNHAFEIVAEAMADTENSDELSRMVKAFNVISKKPSIDGMIGGQIMDIEFSAGKNGNSKDINISEDKILKMYQYKTSALLECALMCGAYLAGADDIYVKRLEEAGRLIGLAFQIRDDILDLTGNEEELGKPVGSDEKNGKNTYVSLVGIEKAREKAKEDSKRAKEIISGLPGDKEFLLELTEYLLERKK